MSDSFYSGFVSIVGPPNVGKSTLLNRILGKKVAAVSPKPQTTRNRIVGVYHGDGFQLVFMDTPGIHRTRTALHQSMVASALATLQEVDILLLMTDVSRPEDPGIGSILGHLRAVGKPSILVLNKTDRVPKDHVAAHMDRFRGLHPFQAIVPVSALQGDGVSPLLKELASRLEPGPQFFPPEMDTDQTEWFLASEMIREQLYHCLREELPYSSAVTVEAMHQDPRTDMLRIGAVIHVETDSQKGMVIGAGGKMIKSIGSGARKELEKRFAARVFLDLRVRVEKNWSRDSRKLKRLGY